MWFALSSQPRHRRRLPGALRHPRRHYLRRHRRQVHPWQVEYRELEEHALGANCRQGADGDQQQHQAGATALGLNVASGHPPFRVNSPTKVANLNTDSLDGHDSTAFGQVREFSHSIAAASAGPPPFDTVTFRGLTLSSESRIISGPLLECDLVATTTDAGQIDNAWTFEGRSSTTALASGSSTPVAGVRNPPRYAGGSSRGRQHAHDVPHGCRATGQDEKGPDQA